MSGLRAERGLGVWELWLFRFFFSLNHGDVCEVLKEYVKMRWQRGLG